MNEFARPSVDWYAIAPVIAVFGAGVLIVALAALSPRFRGLARAALWVALASRLTAACFTCPVVAPLPRPRGRADHRARDDRRRVRDLPPRDGVGRRLLRGPHLVGLPRTGAPREARVPGAHAVLDERHAHHDDGQRPRRDLRGAG